MIDGRVTDHPLRYALTGELHARPFSEMAAPGRALFLALKAPEEAARRDRAGDLAHLTAFIDRHGGAHPAPEANHYFADFGRFQLKWERHTEIVTYTLYETGPASALFQAGLSGHLPEDWLAGAPGQVISAIQIEVLEAEGIEAAMAVLRGKLAPHFASESMACARLLDDNGIAIGDFRIHEGGLARFGLIVHGPAGPRRIGRAVQRLIEMETYRTLAMLAFPTAREVAARLNEIEGALGDLIAQIGQEGESEPEALILRRLTALSAEIETLAAGAAFRFGASGAYETIVAERIAMLREARLEGWQLFSEFMVRRFDPAMRTVHAAERRLEELAGRASRIANLLSTRVNVAVETQNQEVLEKMNRRAALQLRLQATIEGFSVVAISYYAVNLAGYLLAPFAKSLGADKAVVTAVSVLPVVALVWWAVRRIRRGIGHPV